MRIAYVCADHGVDPAGSSGSSTHVRELVQALTARGHDVTMLVTNAAGAAKSIPGPLVDLQTAGSLPELPGRVQKSARVVGDDSRVPREALSLLGNLSLESALSAMNPRPDLVYERQSLWSVAALSFARRAGIPHLLEVNAPLVEQQREHRELHLESVAIGIEGTLLAGSDRILVTSPELVPYARQAGASRRAISVVPCGVSASRFASLPRAGGPTSDRLVLGFLGSLKPWHGIDVMLRAFRKLHKASRCYRLLIVGDGPLRGEVERYLRVHGLDAFSELTGAVEPSEVPAQLARMHVGLAPYPALPSFYFSPLKLWEYAAAGIPIATSDTGNLPRLFPHREAALLHPPGSPTKLAAHVEELRKDPALAARLVRRARRQARLHTWDRIAARVERIAMDAIRSKSGTGA